jgi:hypothetical protein
MAVLAGEKVFHLVSPEDGVHVGAHEPMAEGVLHLEKGAASRVPGVDARWRVVRSSAAVGQPLELHHYAAASLGGLRREHEASAEPAGVSVLRCTARAGDVVYVPAYWLHEVSSYTAAQTAPPASPPTAAQTAQTAPPASPHTAAQTAPPASPPTAAQTAQTAPPASPPTAAAESRVVAVNWFFESFYQRIFPNSSFDRSPHYLLVGEQRDLRQPFPPAGGDAQREDLRMDSGMRGGAAAAQVKRGTGSGRFYARIRERQRDR